MKKFALIVAAGTGSRMNSSKPKQFIELNGKPILMHTIDAFLKMSFDFQFILVLPNSLLLEWTSICEKFGLKINLTLATGGPTRFHSVKNGLDKIDEEGIVFIHDGVRPLVSKKTIENCFKVAVKKGNSLPVVAPSESLRKVCDDRSKAVDRSKHFLVQTPQTFKVSLIKNAYRQDYDKKFTDDASVLEHFGHDIQLVEGNRENIKITFPEDLIFAEAFLNNPINN